MTTGVNKSENKRDLEVKKPDCVAKSQEEFKSCMQIYATQYNKPQREESE